MYKYDCAYHCRILLFYDLTCPGCKIMETEKNINDGSSNKSASTSVKREVSYQSLFNAWEDRRLTNRFFRETSFGRLGGRGFCLVTFL